VAFRGSEPTDEANPEEDGSDQAHAPSNGLKSSGRVHRIRLIQSLQQEHSPEKFLIGSTKASFREADFSGLGRSFSYCNAKQSKENACRIDRVNWDAWHGTKIMPRLTSSTNWISTTTVSTR
jgi:hypothetical protein